MKPTPRPSKRVNELLAKIEKTLGQEYPLEDLRRQRDVLLEFFRLRRKFDAVLSESLFPGEGLRQLPPIIEWCEKNAVLFPKEIQHSINELLDAAQSWWMADGKIPHPTRKAIEFHWNVLEGFDTVLRKCFVEAEANSSPARPAGPMEKFPTPPGANWKDVEIRLLDLESLSIRVKDVRKTVQYAQMGMIDRRNSKPTLQWNLLKDFADGNGTFDWRHPRADRANKKRCQKLAKDLVAFFGINGKPFRLTEDRKGWQARFQIRPKE